MATTLTQLERRGVGSAEALDLAGAVAPTQPHVLMVKVLVVLEDQVVVEVGGDRRGILCLNERANYDLKPIPPKVGDHLQAYVLEVDPQSNNLRLALVPSRDAAALKAPKSLDIWREIYAVGTSHQGVVSERTDSYLGITFPRSTTGRIKKSDLPSHIDFSTLVNRIRVGDSINCRVVRINGRKTKTLDLTISAAS